jgi:hypothetical protein
MMMQPGIRYHCATATAPSGEVAFAIAHMSDTGPVLDANGCSCTSPSS